MSESYMKTPKSEEEKKRLVNRLKRVEGQVRGIQKMIEEDRYCIDVMIQINAINAALNKVGENLLTHHTSHCVLEAIESGDGETAINELVDVMKQYAK
ncbi:MAG TPA: metal-sensing transcriptional repressor [Pseudogracilibacillus sp.]|nr:metal-sensing transcriptional repressor [Pseudogracilibacillus sp.]